MPSDFKSRYASDPAFREWKKAQNREYQQRRKLKPLQSEIERLRGLIHRDRQYYERLKARAERAFERMYARIRQRERLKKKLEERKAA